ncbi:alpha-mannosidase [Brachybacterium ginsengisoli]|uniref:Alpha-mannosidase n=1 Tax=Brachybacterium ginsengisoli TaxID=1331682 RepID=A0A291GYM5_9MICO|nr:alpha-mannosidase [Brachybacterium ginsengisoli]ATG55307.1 alpha-mannosidase [Brachybacterium ginsengisoli]
MHDNRPTSEDRVRRFLGELLPARRHLATAELTIEAWEAPGEPVNFAEAREQVYRPIAVGDRWGRPWSTLWLHLTGTVPASWTVDEDRDVELQLDLSFTDMPGFQAEALIWTPEGETVKAINPYNQYLTLEAGQEIDLYLECAANPNVPGDWTFAPTALGDLATAGEDPIYDLTTLRLAWRSKSVWELEQDMVALNGLLHTLPEQSPRRFDILHALGRALDAADPDDLHASAGQARQELRGVLEAPANASALTVVATGHAHIDSAWLWPLRETRRKCARTFSNVCWLLERYPQLTFSCSSAQQYQWIRDEYPGLFRRIAGHVAAGRFLPVGGMWVESDTNMPGSEAMARQFLHGKKFFLEEFGVETTETWLPDSFGYSAALPQICALAGNDSFLTQKVSWNQYSTFPHHTFEWEGIDGTTQFTHFPPIDGYNGQLTAAELAYFEKNFKDKGASHIGLTPTGWGDGGGGPTREMIAAQERFADLEGAPKVEWSTARDFFDRAREEYAEPPVWNGELYLELHRGTYSSQIHGKQGNRRTEALMHDVELWSATAAHRVDGFDYPYEEIDSLWDKLLLLQFHDILPGSSIAWVHREAEHSYEHITERGEALVAAALEALGDEAGDPVAANSSSRSRHGVAPLAIGAASAPGTAPEVREADGTIRVSTADLHVEIDDRGLLTSLRAGAEGRESIAPGAGGALLQLHRDAPNAWDSWDIDEFYRHVHRDLEADGAPELSRAEDGTVRVAVTYRTREEGHLERPAEAMPSRGTGSRITLTYSVAPGATALGIDLDVDWHERKKVLKLAFPLDVRAAVMSSEIQFGHLDRPVPVNTTADFGRFETCAHRWVRVAEPDFGIALANDSSYGHDVRRVLREDDGGTTTVVRATVLRAAEFPDPSAEEGVYSLRYAIQPEAGVAAAIDLGEELNQAPRVLVRDEPLAPLAALEAVRAGQDHSARIQTLKLAEDRSGDLVVRLYESEGRRTEVELTASGARSLTVADLLERPLTEQSPLGHRAASVEGEALPLTLRPFEITTVRASF